MTKLEAPYENTSFIYSVSLACTGPVDLTKQASQGAYLATTIALSGEAAAEA